MRIKAAISTIIIAGFIIAISLQFSAAIDAPHQNAGNIVDCQNCHVGPDWPLVLYWFPDFTPHNIDETPFNMLCLSCHVAPFGPYTETNAPKVKTHSSVSTSNKYGEWTRQCIHCHKPHKQLQKNYQGTDESNLYLAQGTIESCVDNGDGTSTLTYSSITYKAGWNSSKIIDKTGKGGIYKRSTVLFPDASNLNYSYSITAVDPGTTGTIKVKGDACTNLSPPTTFAVMYGQFVKDLIDVSGTNTEVKFFDQIGTNSFADGDETYDGVCEVCHTRTTHFRNDGLASEQNHENISRGRASGGTNCSRCHKHTDGFCHGECRSCDNCHGHDDGWDEGTYSGTTVSHSTHTQNDSEDFRGPLPVGTCTDCHNTNNYPKFSDGNYLSGTNVCDTCHSPGGGFNGIDSIGGSIGAKDNWETGVYQSNGALALGKEKWCAGCHDNVPSVVKTKIATDIVGNNSTYGYYLDTHGNGIYGVSRKNVTYPKGECAHCHDVSVAKILPTRIIDESFERNPGYDETGLWTETIGTSCPNCILNEDSALPLCNPPACSPPSGAGLQCLKSISASPGYQAYATRDYGSELKRTFTRMYLYVESEGLDDGDMKPIGALRNNTNAIVLGFGLNQNSGQLRFLIRLYYNNGSSYYDDYFDISTNRWYRIEVKYDTDNETYTAYSEWKVDGVSQGSGTLGMFETHYSGIRKWDFGFWSALAETGTIYFDKVAVDNSDWVGEEMGMPLHGGRLFDTSAEFCFKCHDNTTTYATAAIVNRSYSYRSGGWTSDPLDDILEAFSFTSPGSYHNLSDIKTFITDPLRSSWGYTSSSNPCGACHNPHSVQGDPANSPNNTKSPSTRGYPVVRPSEHATNYNNLWGDEALTSERMSVISSNLYWAPKRLGSGYEPDGSSTQDGSNMANYVSLCYDCHNITNVIWSTRLNRNLKRISWASGDFHGGVAKNDGNDGFPGESGDLLEPYKVSGSYQKANYILNCTDCHEPHGSPNEFLLRPTLNGYQANVENGGPISEGKWYYFCSACHSIINIPHFPTPPSNAVCSGCHSHCDGGPPGCSTFF